MADTCFIFEADILCAECGEAVRERLIEEGNAPETPDDEHTFDSDEFPKGPMEASESDSPQHCGHCGCLIESPLTEEGVEYVLESLKEFVVDEGGNAAVMDQWAFLVEDHLTDEGDKFILNAFWAVRNLQQQVADASPGLPSLTVDRQLGDDPTPPGTLFLFCGAKCRDFFAQKSLKTVFNEGHQQHEGGGDCSQCGQNLPRKLFPPS